MAEEKQERKSPWELVAPERRVELMRKYGIAEKSIAIMEKGEDEEHWFEEVLEFLNVLRGKMMALEVDINDLTDVSLLVGPRFAMTKDEYFAAQEKSANFQSFMMQYFASLR